VLYYIVMLLSFRDQQNAIMSSPEICNFVIRLKKLIFLTAIYYILLPTKIVPYRIRIKKGLIYFV